VRILFLSTFIVLADQLSKLAVKGISIPFLGISVQGLQLGSSRPILGDFLRLTYIENPGMAFGIDIGGKLFFSLFSILASAAILVYLYKARHESLPFRISLALILGGAVGNLIDRVFYGVLFNDGDLFYGRVVDFIDADFFNVNLFGYHLSRWPVFNVADAAVTCGVLLMLFAHRRASVAHESGLQMNSSSNVIGAPVISSDPPPPSGDEPPRQ
jgi:signal peptidase II